MKHCNYCKETKPIEEMVRVKDKVRPMCKKCNAERARAHYYGKVRPNKVNVEQTEKVRAALKEARANGDKFYETGRPCVKGHIGPRLTENQQCAECQRQHKLARYDRASSYKKKRAMVKRKVAAQLGRLHYFTGDPCSKGHIANRLVSTKQCVTCLAGRPKKPWKALSEEQYQRINAARRSRAGRVRSRKYYQDKLKGCTLHKMTSFMRACLRRCFTAKNNARTHEILGYFPEQLKYHIESLFEEGMTWGNYGEWHIDHDKPISAFLKEGVFDPRQVNALYNLKPMWGAENISKGSHWEGSPQAI